MKKSIYILLAIGFLFNSCRKPLKDVNDYFPKVKTVSATVQLDGSVLVKGELESPGKARNAVMDNVGVCFSTSVNPKMNDGQIIASLDGTSFTAIYQVTDFNVDSVYYFNTWGTNNYGYAMGEAIAVDSIIATPVIAPCSWAMNYVNIGSGPSAYYYSVGAPDSYNYFSAATGSGPTVNFQFGSALTTGIFHTTTNPSPYAGEVFVSLYQGFISGALASGTNVYVNRLSATSHEITICHAPWTYSSSTFYFDTHFVTPY